MMAQSILGLHSGRNSAHTTTYNNRSHTSGWDPEGLHGLWPRSHWSSETCAGPHQSRQKGRCPCALQSLVQRSSLGPQGSYTLGEAPILKHQEKMRGPVKDVLVLQLWGVHQDKLPPCCKLFLSITGQGGLRGLWLNSLVEYWLPAFSRIRYRTEDFPCQKDQTGWLTSSFCHRPKVKKKRKLAVWKHSQKE